MHSETAQHLVAARLASQTFFGSAPCHSPTLVVSLWFIPLKRHSSSLELENLHSLDDQKSVGLLGVSNMFPSLHLLHYVLLRCGMLILLWYFGTGFDNG